MRKVFAEISYREISFSEAAEIWRADLWSEKPQSVKPSSHLLFEGGYDSSISRSYSAVYFGAFSEDVLIGVNSGHPSSPTDFRTRGLYVHPDFRGHGIGRQLLRNAIHHAFTRGFGLVWSYPRRSSWFTFKELGFQDAGRALRPEEDNICAYLEVEPGHLAARGHSGEEEWIRGVQGRLNETSPSLCLAQFTHRTINLQEGSIRTCCHAEPKAIENTPGKSLFYHSSIAIDQKLMLTGKRPSSCKVCWELEDAGLLSDRAYFSSRRWVWREFPRLQADSAEAVESPLHLEITFDNICQMKCSYCRPAASSSWEQEALQVGPYPTTIPYNPAPTPEARAARTEARRKAQKSFWDAWDTVGDSLKYLHILGGEPLLSPAALRLLEDLASRRRPKLNVLVHSNLGHDDEKIGAFLDYIRRIQPNVAKLMVFTSIDSIGTQAEYIRSGLAVDRFFGNVERILRETPAGLHLEFVCTIGCLSLPGLTGLLEELQRIRRTNPQHSISCDMNPLLEPSFMSVGILPVRYAAYLDNAIEFMEANCGSGGFSGREISLLKRIRLLLKNGGASAGRLAVERADFYRMFREYDRRRSTNFLATFPEYQEFWAECAAAAGCD